ncbi:hypothetical protein N7474_004801 [Penicillium riverlandense]|uniref:uncharacterized protein n=1 Tax=Penicillium riverlandense TaxID=1903569 RepID=UPI002548E626|nr:uncharacterized protein N7474_004801 [Penicillium riverlandense]KAJ5819210.1 hypothetical protein N7474_004801 [Penicillium riverlandense]
MDQTEEKESVQPHNPMIEGQGIISSPSKEHEATPHLSFSLQARSCRGAELSRIPRVPGLTQMLRASGETSRDSSPDTTAPLSPIPRRSAIPIRVRRDTATAQEYSSTESPSVQTGGIRLLSGSSSHSSTSSQPQEDGDNHNNLATIPEKSLDNLAGSTGSIPDDGDLRPAPIRMGPTVRISSSADRYILGHETDRTHARPEAYRLGNVYYPRVIQADSPPNETEDGGGLSTGQESGYDADDEPHLSTADSQHDISRTLNDVETHPQHDISPGHSYFGARIGMGQAARHTPQHIIDRRPVLGSAIAGPSSRAFLGFSSHPPDTQGSLPSDVSPELLSSRRLLMENPSRLPGMEPRSHGGQSSSSNDPFNAPPIRLPIRGTFTETQEGPVYPWHEERHSQSPKSPIASRRPLAKFSSYHSDVEGQSRRGQTSESEDFFHGPPSYRQSAVTTSRSSPQVETLSHDDKAFRPKELSYGPYIRRKQVPQVSQSPPSKIPRRDGSPPSDRGPTGSQQLPQTSSGATLTDSPVVHQGVSPTGPGDAGRVGTIQRHSRTTSRNPLLDFVDTESGCRPIALGPSASIPTLRSNLTFDDIVTRHPEVEGRVIQTNVARITERRTARLVGNLRHVFSRNRAERRDSTFEIVNARTTSRGGGSSSRKEPRNKLAQTIRASASTAALPRLSAGLQRRAPSLPQLSTTAQAYSTGSPGERDSHPRIRAVRSGSFIPRIGHRHYKGPAARTGATRMVSEGGDLEPRRVQACLRAIEEGLVQEMDLDGRRSLLSAWTDLRSLYSDYVSRDARVSESAQLLSQLRVEVKLVKCALLVELERAYAQLDSRNDAGVADGVAGDE